MGKTKIEWTDATWNPVTGCTPCSPGCDHCYAERMARRNAGRNGYPDAPDHFKVTLHPDRLLEAFSWRKPRRVFVCSMGDLFHDDVPDAFLDKVFAVMALTGRHTYRLLTKRPARMHDYLNSLVIDEKHRLRIAEAALRLRLVSDPDNFVDSLVGNHDPPDNVGLGVTAEDQAQADARIPVLLQCPAALRFVSIEPMLGPVDLTRVQWPQKHRVDVLRGGFWKDHQPLKGFVNHSDFPATLDWVIAGGETGPGARPMHHHWVRSLRDQCKAAGVPFFLKQWGEWLHHSQVQGVAPDPADWKSGELVAWHPSGTITVAPRQNPHLAELTVEGEKFCRVGKARAGHLLDGIECREYPEREQVTGNREQEVRS